MKTSIKLLIAYLVILIMWLCLASCSSVKKSYSKDISKVDSIAVEKVEETKHVSSDSVHTQEKESSWEKEILIKFKPYIRVDTGWIHIDSSILISNLELKDLLDGKLNVKDIESISYKSKGSEKTKDSSSFRIQDSSHKESEKKVELKKDEKKIEKEKETKGKIPFTLIFYCIVGIAGIAMIIKFRNTIKLWLHL